MYSSFLYNYADVILDVPPPLLNPLTLGANYVLHNKSELSYKPSRRAFNQLVGPYDIIDKNTDKYITFVPNLYDASAAVNMCNEYCAWLIRDIVMREIKTAARPLEFSPISSYALACFMLHEKFEISRIQVYVPAVSYHCYAAVSFDGIANPIHVYTISYQNTFRFIQLLIDSNQD